MNILNLLKQTIFFCLILLFFFSASAQSGKRIFKREPGIVSYTYRNYFSKDFSGTLDIIQKNGIKDIEFSSLFGKSASEIRKELDQRGLYCSSFGVSYDDFVNKTAEVAQNAKTLGATYVRVAGIPHKGAFTREDADKAIGDFNRTAKILKEQYGLNFIYHNHGFEFEPYEDGTLYDYIVKNTDSKYVNFELDILWAYFPGQDPAALLTKYGKRYKALHLKDLKNGVKGNMSGGTAQDNDVVLGTGQIDIPDVLAAAEKAGVEHYYIEDESSDALTQVPKSIDYLKNFRK